MVVKGDQYNKEAEWKLKVSNVIFTNNVFTSEQCWTNDFSIKDQNPIFIKMVFKEK